MYTLLCARFLIGSGVDFGSIFDDFLLFFEVIVRLLFLLFRSRAQNGKLCLDCTGVGGLHVRPSRGTAGPECFSRFFLTFSLDCCQDSISDGF